MTSIPPLPDKRDISIFKKEKKGLYQFFRIHHVLATITFIFLLLLSSAVFPSAVFPGAVFS